jgi:hypothetical protein
MAGSGLMAQGGELLCGDTFARPWDFYTIFPLREAKRSCGFAAVTSAPVSNSADASGRYRATRLRE